MAGSRVFALVLAAGRGTRLGRADNKVYLNLGGSSIVSRSLRTFENAVSVESVFCVVRPGEEALMEREIRIWKLTKPLGNIVIGGERRFDSVKNGLEAIADLPQPPEVVMIHDGARPFIDPKSIERLIEAALEHGAATAAYPAVDTISVSEDGRTIRHTPDRATLWQIQTPQVFRFPLILDAYRRWDVSKGAPTDDAAVLRAVGGVVHLVETSPYNIKITRTSDLTMAEALLKAGLVE